MHVWPFCEVHVIPMAPPRKLPRQQPAPKQATMSAAMKSEKPCAGSALLSAENVMHPSKRTTHL